MRLEEGRERKTERTNHTEAYEERESARGRLLCDWMFSYAADCRFRFGLHIEFSYGFRVGYRMNTSSDCDIRIRHAPPSHVDRRCLHLFVEIF